MMLQTAMGLLLANIFAKKLFTQLFQSAVLAQFFHRCADFGQGLVVAFIDDKTGA